VEIIDKTITGDNLELRELVEPATLNARVAGIIYDARKAAGLTQRQLAELIGTDQAVISRLEDSDYDGHSLSMLNRIAKALGGHVDIRLVPDEKVAVG
jgi:transcriptional regulator with XRE-family HTH domain